MKARQRVEGCTGPRDLAGDAVGMEAGRDAEDTGIIIIIIIIIFIIVQNPRQFYGLYNESLAHLKHSDTYI